MSIYDVKNKLDSEKDDNIVDEIDDDDKDKLEEALDDVQDWMQSSEDADKDAWQEKVDSFDSATRPILKKYAKKADAQPDSDAADDDDFEFKDEL